MQTFSIANSAKKRAAPFFRTGGAKGRRRAAKEGRQGGKKRTAHRTAGPAVQWAEKSKRFQKGEGRRHLTQATAQATVAPTMGLLPMPMKPIMSTWAGTEEEPANWASPCMRPMESVRP